MYWWGMCTEKYFFLYPFHFLLYLFNQVVALIPGTLSVLDLLDLNKRNCETILWYTKVCIIFQRWWGKGREEDWNMKSDWNPQKSFLIVVTLASMIVMCQYAYKQNIKIKIHRIVQNCVRLVPPQIFNVVTSANTETEVIS